MKWLVFIHVISAVIGIGPTYFGHLLLRKGQTIGGLRQSITLINLLNYFPKIGGTLAVVSGIVLVIMSWSFSSFWIIGSLVIYVAIQVVVIGFMTPVINKLQESIQDPALPQDHKLPEASNRLLSKANRLFYTASIWSILLFALMILKP